MGTPVRLPRAPAASPRQQWRGGLTAAYASEAGVGHARNEDCCSHAPSAERPGFCGVADGVGGGAHGEIASSVLLTHCALAPKETVRDPVRLADWVTQGDAEVRDAIARRTDEAGAATLAAAWFPTRSTVYVVNVGDCRVYRLSPRSERYAIERITVDQTYAALRQAPPPNGRPDDPARMVGAGAVGVPPVVKTELRERELLLLCSDGVHKFVADQQMADVVALGLSEGSSLERICDALVRAAKRNGSHDDASALLVLRRPWFAPRWTTLCALVAVLVLWLLFVQGALAETQSVIDPTEATEPANPPARKAKKAPQTDPALKRERQRALEEQRRRETAEARALAAENETAKLRSAEQAAARKAAAARAAATRAAAAKAAKARIAAEILAAEQAAWRAAAAAEAAAREEAAREAAAREAAAREQAAREQAAREQAAREAATREAAVKEASARTAAREAAAREYAARKERVELALGRHASARQTAWRPQPRHGTVFRDCADCPELVWLPQGEFVMGEANGANGPRYAVSIHYMLAVGRFEVTFAEWDACVAVGGCRRRPDDAGWGRGRQPAVNISWADAQQYVAWLSRKTGKRYRLLSEAEWEYAARAGSHVRFWWGDDSGRGDANCYGCGSRWDGRRAAPVGSFAPNPFGLHDMHGNVSEWVEDCYRDNYREGSTDASASACTIFPGTRMLRGGGWRDSPHATRSAARFSASVTHYDNRIGFRIARTE